MKRIVITAAAFLTFATIALAANFLLTKTAETNNTITFTYQQQSGADGYRYYAPGAVSGQTCSGTRVSRTLDPARTSIRFSKVADGTYCVEAIVLTPIGSAQYPTAPPPPPSPQCSDGKDNDADGYIDYPSDRGCTSLTDTDETDVTPVTQCSDGIDNADPEDTLVDMADPGCSSSADNDETNTPPSSASLFVSTNGNDGNACSQGSPCQTWNRAYQLASCGTVVEVAGGSYPSQTFTERAAISGCATNVEFRPAAGATVNVNGSVSLGNGFFGQADHITLRGFSYTDSISMNGDADHILVDNVNGGSVHIDNGASFVTVRNSDFGPCNSPAGPAPQCERFFILDASKDSDAGDSCGCATHDILVEGNTIHDYEITSPDHWEALFATGGTNVTIRGNRFYDNEIYHISIGENAYGNFNNWTIENNWFGRSCNSCESGNTRNSAVKLGSPYQLDNILIRYNSFAPGQSVVNEDPTKVTLVNVRVVGNIFGTAQSTDCANIGTVDWNAFINSGNGAGCGSNKRILPSAPYVNSSPSAGMDYHLAGASGADGFVTATSADASLGFDYDGQSRTVPRDAGSDEH